MTEFTELCHTTASPGLAPSMALVVSDDEEVVERLCSALEGYGYSTFFVEASAFRANNVSIGSSGKNGDRGAAPEADVVFLEAGRSDLISNVAASYPEAFVVALREAGNPEGDLQSAVQAGAWDVLYWPMDESTFRALLRRIDHVLQLRRQRAAALAKLHARDAELRSIKERVAELSDTARGSVNSQELDVLGPLLLRAFAKNMMARGGSIYGCHSDGLKLIASLDPGHAPDFVPFPLRPGSVFDTVLTECRPFAVRDVSMSRELIPSGWDGYNDGTCLVFPLEDAEDRIVGLLALHGRSRPPFSQQDAQFAAILAAYTCETLRVTQTQGALTQSESRLRAVFDSAEDVIFMKDVQLRYTHVNPSMERLFDAAAGRIIGRSDYEIFSEEDAARMQAVDRRVLAGETVVAEEDIPIRGRHYTFHVIKVPLHNSDGETVGLCGIARDITQRKKEELQLDLERRQLLSILDGFVEPAYVSDPDTYEILFANAVLRDSLGATHGKKCYEVLQGLDRPCPFCTNDRLFGENGTDAYVWETQNQRNGRWYRCIDRAIPWPDGRSVRCEIAIDITERKEVEAALSHRLRMEELVAAVSQKFVNITVDEVPGALDQCLRMLGEFIGSDRSCIIEYDQETRLASARHEWNAEGVPAALDGFRELFADDFPWWMDKMKRSATIHVPDTDAVPPEAEAERTIMLSAGIKSLLAVPMWANRMLCGVLVLSTVRSHRQWLQEDSVLLQIAAEVFAGALSRVRQEEERERLEHQVRQAQKLESLGVLAGGIAHDFNNLLMGILGNTSVALMDLQESSPLHATLQHVETAGRRAAELCRQMLAYSGRGHFLVEPLDLSHVVSEMAHLLEVSLTKKALLQYNLEEALPAVEGDVTQIRQVIMNLITNASEAIGERNGVVSVRTGVKDCSAEFLRSTYLREELPPGRYVYLQVSDNGCGMDEETISKIFDPFFTTKFTGRGLGLAALLGIVRGHGGALTVASKVGIGSVFRVFFPESSLAPVSVPAEACSNVPWRGKGTVLVVDDEESVRKVASLFLERLGFCVLAACDGQQAVEIYRECGDEIVLILLDLTMPQMSGEETFAVLRAVNPAARVLLSSGYSEKEAQDRFTGQGTAGFLQKPYQFAEFTQIVRTALESGADGV